MTKYRSKETVAHGVKWDSLSELARYEDLLEMQKRGEIKNLKYHSKEIKFLLLEKCEYVDFYGEKKKQMAITYTPDFTYTHNGALVAEDVKGIVTDAFRLKEKLFRARYPKVILRVVKAYKTKQGFKFTDIR